MTHHLTPALSPSLREAEREIEMILARAAHLYGRSPVSRGLRSGEAEHDALPAIG